MSYRKLNRQVELLFIVCHSTKWKEHETCKIPHWQLIGNSAPQDLALSLLSQFGCIIFTILAMHAFFNRAFDSYDDESSDITRRFVHKKDMLKTCDSSMHQQIWTAIYNINIQVQNPDHIFFGVHRALRIHVFFDVEIMGPWARICTENPCGEILTDILTVWCKQ